MEKEKDVDKFVSSAMERREANVDIAEMSTRYGVEHVLQQA